MAKLRVDPVASAPGTDTIAARLWLRKTSGRRVRSPTVREGLFGKVALADARASNTNNLWRYNRWRSAEELRHVFRLSIVMNKTFALILIFVSSGALYCSGFRSSMTATAVQSPSVDEQRPLAPASCPVTLAPAVPFTPPGLPERVKDDTVVWFGTEKLWTSLRRSGDVWGWGPRPPGSSNLTNKIFWFSVDYDRHKEGNANLKVTGRRLDGDAPPLWALPTTNALGHPYDAMLTGVYMPTPGCWEITGDYKGQKLSFVVWLYPVKQANH